jgi:nucleoside-diphosphate-sugar epimerase
VKVLVTGACGYKGTVLVSKLLLAGYEVIAFDIMWFGNYLAPHDGLRVIKGDVRDTASVPLDDVDAVIHLSSVANDPCGDLDPQLTWEISCLATMRLADKAVRMGVKHFIYASSGSVYGVKTEQQVTENLELLPLSEYNKTKMVGERVLLSYSKNMIVQIVRPATVCGLSPRMRLDVSVNLLTMQALTKNEITVLGGDQTRPNIHIDDITDLYLFLLRRPELQGIYNAGFENMSINDMALLIQASTNAEILKMPSNDPRSYRLNSDKLLATGFSPKKNVDIAIREICAAYQRGELENKPQFNNLLYMQTEVFK